MFDFQIRFIFIEEAYNGMVSSGNGLTPYQFLMSVYDTEKDEMYQGNRYYTWNNNRFSWYSALGYTPQLNYGNRKYYYIGF